jgi:hypothetical protein
MILGHIIDCGRQEQDLHGLPHFGIPVPHNLNQIPALRRDAQFFAQLAVKRLARRLTGTHLPARKFPLAA